MIWRGATIWAKQHLPPAGRVKEEDKDSITGDDGVHGDGVDVDDGDTGDDGDDGDAGDDGEDGIGYGVHGDGNLLPAVRGKVKDKDSEEGYAHARDYQVHLGK